MTILAAGGRSMMLRQPEIIKTTNIDRVPSAEIPSGRFSMKKGMHQEPIVTAAATDEVPPAKSTRKTKKIRFHDTVRVRSHLHVDDMTDAEFFNAWYSDDEMSNMKKNMARDLKRFLAAKQAEKKNMMRKKKQLIVDFMTKKSSHKSEVLTNHYIDNYGLDSNKFTLRGLENRTRKGNEIRRRIRFTALHAVLKEQQMQCACGCFDDESIRNVYLKRGSKLSAIEANKVGIKDRREAKLIHEEQAEETKLEEQSKQETKDESSNTNGLVFNTLYIQTFHKKRKVLDELREIITELKIGHEEDNTVVEKEVKKEFAEQNSGKQQEQEVTKVPKEALKQPNPKSLGKRQLSFKFDGRKHQEKKSNKLINLLQISAPSATCSKGRRRFPVFKK